LVSGGLFIALWAAYALQFFSAIGEKGQGPMGKAFETIGYHALQKQYNGIPQMRVVRAFAESNQCSFWNFEWTWGRCVGISLYVRDYRPEQQSILDAQVHLLAEQLRKPCTLLTTLGLPNEREIARDLGCSQSKRTFKLLIVATSVKLLSERSDDANPQGWWAADHKKLYSYYFQGEI
ncbi:MAG: hypothetical protein NTX56_18005, partial [Proteobacteria bacterium]|nr:hypothetical protein [Pseudomonadota bacterium]